MDIAAFKVGHSVGSDTDTTALPAARARSVSIGVCEKGGEGVQPMRAGGGVEVSIGAMERYMRGFDLAQNSPSPAKTHRQHTVSIPVGRWMKCLGTGKAREEGEHTPATLS